MSTDKPGDKRFHELPGTDPPDTQANDPLDDGKRSGRAAYDERGNPIWEWQLETGVYSRDISTQRLQKLDLNDLSIAETATHPRPPGLGPSSGGKPLPGGGVNPYDNSSTARGKVDKDPYSKGVASTLKFDPMRAANQAASPRPRKPVDMRKLQEWIELRKRVAKNKGENDDDA